MEAIRVATAEDHQDLGKQLGIVALRPGPSGRAGAPNEANYDKAEANPFPNLPPLLRMENGKTVKSAKDWWQKRRPEIAELFEKEVVGRVPPNAPRVTWTVRESETIQVGGVDVLSRKLVGKADNSGYPSIDVEIRMTLVTPVAAAKPVPVMVMFTFGGGSPSEGMRQLVAAGWGYASLTPSSIQEDNGAGLTRGVIGLTNRGARREPEDWGALRAWAWGASRALDYLETDKKVDAKRVGIEGVSRYGKAALVTMAFDTRFAVVLVGSSGEGGAKLHRRNFGEAVENLTSSGEYHWMAGNFLKFGAEQASFGSKNAGDIPVDAHQLIALCAPRPTFISYGIPEKGDAKWLDQRGSFMAAVAAQPAFQLLGAKGMGMTEMPEVNVSLLDGQLAWRQHDGGHTDGPNWKYFIPWTDRMTKLR
ncbi:MAG: acetylxylan esterase [Acidobacteria bacterium]|nr:acetylxylan esterase [Acidobacteriota bacterium]